MARVLRFSGLQPGTHTWYEDQLQGGRYTRIEPGAVLAVAGFANPDHYVRSGFAVYEGEDSGAPGTAEALAADLRELAARHAIVVTGAGDVPTVPEVCRSILARHATDLEAHVQWVQESIAAAEAARAAEAEAQAAVTEEAEILSGMPASEPVGGEPAPQDTGGSEL